MNRWLFSHYVQRFRSILARRHNVRAHFWQSLSNYTQQFTGLVLSVILARLLTPEDFGEFAYVTSVIGLFLLPASWSLAAQVVSEISTHPEIVSDALWVSRKIFLARFVLAIAACGFLWWAHSPKSVLLGIIVAAPLVAGEFITVLRAMLEGRGQFKINFYDSLIVAAFTACIGLPAAWLGAGVWALAAPAIPLFLAQMTLFTKSTRLGIFSTSPPSGRSYFQSGLNLWIASMGEGALVRADKFLLGKFSTMASLGDYNRAYNYAPLSARMMNSLLTNATISGLTRAADGKHRRWLLIKCAALLAVGGLLNFAVFWWFSADFVPWIFGPQWVSAIPVFEAMAPLSLVISFAYLPTCVILAKRRYRLLAATRIATLVAFLACALWLGSDLNAVKMAWLLQGALILQGSLLIFACGTQRK